MNVRTNALVQISKWNTDLFERRQWMCTNVGDWVSPCKRRWTTWPPAGLIWIFAIQLPSYRSELTGRMNCHSKSGLPDCCRPKSFCQRMDILLQFVRFFGNRLKHSLRSVKKYMAINCNGASYVAYLVKWTKKQRPNWSYFKFMPVLLGQTERKQ